MGILTNLLDTAWREQDARRQEEQNRYATIAQVPGIRPEIQEWAIDQLVKTAPKSAPGLKDIGGLFKGLIKRGSGGQQGLPGFQQALASTGRPGMTAQIPAGPQVSPTSIPGSAPPGGPQGPPTEFGGGSLANVLPGGQEQIPGITPSLMLSPQEQLALKLDEFKQTERIRNDLQGQMQAFLNEQQLEQQKKQDEAQTKELQRRLGLFVPAYGEQLGRDMAFTSMNLTKPESSSSAVSGLVLGSDPQLQEWGKQHGVTIDVAKQYHVMRDSGGKITNALEGPAAGGRGGFKGALGELADAQAVVDEGVGGSHKYTASDVKAAKDFITKYNRPPSTVINLGEKKAEAKDIAAAIRSGDQPPLTTGLGVGMAGPVRQELAKSGFNLSRAQQDWTATQAYIRSLNGAQQLRLRQATDFAYESLNLIDNPEDPGNDLIGQVRRFVPRTRFPIINQAALNAAKNGAFGDAAASAARQLDSQITDLQSELATVYKGGNSPTDVGLNQASKMLSDAWSENTLRDAVDLSRKNLRYRLNSIRNTGPSGVSAESPYTPAPPPSTPVDTTPVNRAAGTSLPKPPRQGAAIGAADLQKYLDANGGDVTKTRKAVTDAGWVIPK